MLNLQNYIEHTPHAVRFEDNSYLDTVEACFNAQNNLDFIQEVQPKLAELLGSQMLYAGTYNAIDQSSNFSYNFNFPNVFTQQVLLPNCEFIKPYTNLWKQSGKPVFSSNEEPSCGTSLPVAIGKSFGLKNVVYHEMDGFHNSVPTYFLFANLTQWNSQTSRLIELLTPTLYHLVVRLSNATKTNNYSELTKREKEILSWVCEGKTNDEIGMILSISKWTVKAHLKNIMTKLNVSTRSQAVRQAISRQLITSY